MTTDPNVEDGAAPGRTLSTRDRFLGCMLGGAVGDALGAPIEFDSLESIRARHGPQGVSEYLPAYGRVGAITDDTQMTLFTAEGLLRGCVRAADHGLCHTASMVGAAYLRWLHTQGELPAGREDEASLPSGWLMTHEALFARRAPGQTCLAALRASKRGSAACNDSKGCGGVMRVAPVGLLKPGDAFENGVTIAALTHGHPTGSLSAGALALIISRLVAGDSIASATASARERLLGAEAAEETLHAIDAAVEMAHRRPGDPDAIANLGEGWIAEEALSIALYCALCAQSFEHGVVLSVNHDGDSDSTGSIAGQILGTLMGAPAIPERWLDQLELRNVIEQVAIDLYEIPRGDVDEPDTELRQSMDQYPGY